MPDLLDLTDWNHPCRDANGDLLGLWCVHCAALVHPSRTHDHEAVCWSQRKRGTYTLERPFTPEQDGTPGAAETGNDRRAE